MPVKLSIIYYSATSTTYKLAKAMEQSAQNSGAEVRLRKVAELVHKDVISSNPAWTQHIAETQHIPEASHDDLTWADALLIGSPTRYGLPAAQLKHFIDGTGSLWAKGALVNKVVSSFTSAATTHGGHESTLVALNNVFYHWGCILVPPGYTDAVQFASGTPYGTSFVSQNGELEPDSVALDAAKHQAKRLVDMTSKLIS